MSRSAGKSGFSTWRTCASGNNVGISGATFVTHSAAIRIVEKSYGVKADAVGGVVTRDVLPNTVAGGNPARVLCSMDEFVERTVKRSRARPSHGLIETRNTGGKGIDRSLEPELKRHSVGFFFGASNP